MDNENKSEKTLENNTQGGSWLNDENKSQSVNSSPSPSEQFTPPVSSDAGSQPPASPFESSLNVNPVGINTQVNSQQGNSNSTENSFSTPPIVGPHSNSDGKGFKIFVIIGILVIIAVWSYVAYLYFQKKSKSNKNENQASTQIPSASPTPAFSPDWVKIKSGSIILQTPNGQETVLVDKEEYPSTGITGFLKVAVSPDYKKICFEAWPPAPEPALYISEIDGKNVKEVNSNRQNCVWSKDSTKIYYVNTAPKTSPVNIFEYDLNSETETDLTEDSVTPGTVRKYEIVGLSADGSKIICRYENIGGAATSENINQCEINLDTGEVTTY